ncbi:MAG: glycosyltransferase [Planctomycetes bacterium]|nr:glycosyltransferase [Planctomycetota bacterium]MCB9904902.1 glycosyltransferase [Planctomycetota bacterium]
MKLAHVLSQDPTRFRGGTEVVTWAQARAQAALGHDVRVVVPAHGREAVGSTMVDGVELVRVDRGLRLAPTVFVDAEARDAVLRATADVDLVHVHHWYGWSLDLVRHLAVERAVVLHLHDAFSTCARSFRVPAHGASCPTGGGHDACARCLAPDFAALGTFGVSALLEERRDLLQVEFAAADAVVAPSAWLARLVAEALGTREPLVVPHGPCVDPDARVEFVPREDGAPLRLLHAGNRATVKGCLDLARAVAALPEGSAVLRFVGREVEAGLDRRLSEVGGESVVIEGEYELADWPRLAAEHDICLLPSLAAESYGLVAEEALALGLPTWVADSGALPERVESAHAADSCAGRVLPAGSPEAWTEALLELVESPGRLHHARRLLPRRTRSVHDSALQLLDLGRALLAADPRLPLRSA